MDAGETGVKPVVITDSKSNSKMFLSLVIIGAVVGSVVLVGNLAIPHIVTVPKHETLVKDQELVAKCDALVKAGDLLTARKLLESTELATGLSPEMSEKLDTIYTLQAKQSIASGKTKEAIDTLNLVPPESPHYQDAQSTIKSLKAAPKAKSAPKPHASKSQKSSRSKHHK